MQNGTDTLEDSLMFCYKIKYTLALQSSSFVPGYLTKGIKNLYAHKYLYTDVYSSFIYNCQTWKQPRCFSVGICIINYGIARWWNIIQCTKKWAMKRQVGNLNAYN